jgi:hypothetical protein
LFLAWREKGDAGWARQVEEYVDLAGFLEQLVVDNSNLELMSSRQWSNVCLRYTALEIDHDIVNIELRDRMMRNGNFMISRSQIGNNIILRPVVSNPNVTKESLILLVNEIVSVGNDIIRGIPF